MRDGDSVETTTVRAGDIEQLLSDGRKVRIRAKGDEFTEITDFVDKGVRPALHVTCGGARVTVGEDHLFRTQRGWVKARDLAEGSYSVSDGEGGWNDVERIEDAGEQPIVDLTVAHEESCYVAQNMLHHNSGKSLIATHVLANTQEKGGIAVYIDTESAADPDFLDVIGVDRDKGFIYVQEHEVSKIFAIIERVVSKIRDKDNERFVTVVVDSIAGMTTEGEDASDYGKEGYATDKAIILSKSMRKLTNLLGRERILLVFTNQVRDNVGCVVPGTMITARHADGGAPFRLTMGALFERCNVDWQGMEVNGPVDVQDQGLQLHGPDGWRDVLGLVRKRDSETWALMSAGGGTLLCSGQHLVRVRDGDSEVLREVQHLTGDERVMHGGQYLPFSLERTGETAPILDVYLAGDHVYEADGVASHNTMYGDKFVTPGGKAVPFHSSVRIELRKSKSIVETVKGERKQIGAQIRPNVTKNRLGPPGRKCEFDLYFSSGIDDAGSLWNKLKAHGIIKHKGGGWYRTLAREDEEEKWFQEDGDDFLVKKPDASEHSFPEVINNHEEFRERCYEHLYEHEVMTYDSDWTGSADKEYVEAEDADPREAGKPGISDHVSED